MISRRNTYILLVIIFSFLSSEAQESRAGAKVYASQEDNRTGTYPKFHPRGFYMNWGYVYETGSFPNGGYKANGVSWDFGGKIFNKARLRNKVQVGVDLSSTFQWCLVNSFVNSTTLGFNQHEAYFPPWIFALGIKVGPSIVFNLKNKNFIFITPQLGMDYFAGDYSFPAFGFATGCKFEFVHNRFLVGASGFFVSAWQNSQQIVLKSETSFFIGFKLSNPSTGAHHH